MIYLYCLKSQNTIKYVGLTKNPRKREYDHRRTKPPFDDFVILEKFKNQDSVVAAHQEIDLISLYNTVSVGWNISSGGEYHNNSGYNRKGIGGQKKGCVVWNKGKINCFSDQTITLMKKIRKGKIHSSKVNIQIVAEIRQKYKNHPIIVGVGKPRMNGKILTQSRAFSALYHGLYGMSSANMFKIIERKSWTHIK